MTLNSRFTIQLLGNKGGIFAILLQLRNCVPERSPCCKYSYWCAVYNQARYSFFSTRANTLNICRAAAFWKCTVRIRSSICIINNPLFDRAKAGLQQLVAPRHDDHCHASYVPQQKRKKYPKIGTKQTSSKQRRFRLKKAFLSVSTQQGSQLSVRHRQHPAPLQQLELAETEAMKGEETQFLPEDEEEKSKKVMAVRAQNLHRFSFFS